MKISLDEKAFWPFRAHPFDAGVDLHALEGGFEDGLGFAHKGYHRAVGGLTRIHVQKFYTLDGRNGCRNTINDRAVAALAEVGHTFNNSFHEICVLKF